MSSPVASSRAVVAPAVEWVQYEGMNAPSADRPVEGGPVESLARLHPWRRYVALGDSFTEGVGDPEPGSPGGLRG